MALFPEISDLRQAREDANAPAGGAPQIRLPL